ncbi:MAG: alpha/beta hydrolase family protein [Phycisphaerales bacterium]
MPDPPATLPSRLRAAARMMRLGPDEVPALVAHPDWDSGRPVPMVIWMHGRTVSKELDPGRYLRWIRAGIAAVAIDLPGHGERFDPELQRPERTLDVVLQMADQIDAVHAAALALGVFDPDRIGIGGMSAGGMATLNRLTRPHAFACASVEATTGSWRHQASREMFRDQPTGRLDGGDPIQHLDGWRPIPFQAIHTRADEWVDFAGQAAFVDAIRKHQANPADRAAVDFVVYDETGAPNEHAGFGRFSADAKDRQREFLSSALLD